MNRRKNISRGQKNTRYPGSKKMKKINEMTGRSRREEEWKEMAKEKLQNTEKRKQKSEEVKLK